MLTPSQFLKNRWLYDEYCFERSDLIAKRLFEKQENKKVKNKIKEDCMHYHKLWFSYRKIWTQLWISRQTAFNYIKNIYEIPPPHTLDTPTE